MKKSLLTLIIIATIQITFAQNTIARFKFEDAEEAFALNNYELTLSKLKEVEALLNGTNPKIIYLQILAQSKIIEKDPLNDWLLLKNTRTLSGKYLIDYENLPDNEDKYRDIYKASEALKKWPSSVDEFRESKEKRQQVHEGASSNANKLELSRNYINTLAEKYKFKKGLALSEFVKYNSEAQPLSKTKKHADNEAVWYSNEHGVANVPKGFDVAGSYKYAFTAGYGFGDPSPVGPFKISIAKGSSSVTGYDYVFYSGKEEGVVTKNYENLKSDIEKNIDAEFIKSVDGGIDIIVPGSEIEISLKLKSQDKWFAAIIGFRAEGKAVVGETEVINGFLLKK